MVHAYLDDSIREPLAVCAALVVGAERVAEAEAVLDHAKECAGVDASARLHCRELFAGDARARGPWKGLDPSATRLMISKLCRDLRPVTLPPYGYIVRAEDVSGASIGAGGQIWSGIRRPSLPWPTGSRWPFFTRPTLTRA